MGALYGKPASALVEKVVRAVKQAAG
jgi:hypothetical protein